MIDCCFSSSVVGVRGAWDYRSMLVCRLLMQHWIKEDLPVAQLLQANHTVFSEESGEIALSVLVHSQPPNTHTELTITPTIDSPALHGTAVGVRHFLDTKSIASSVQTFHCFSLVHYF